MNKPENPYIFPQQELETYNCFSAIGSGSPEMNNKTRIRGGKRLLDEFAGVALQSIDAETRNGVCIKYHGNPDDAADAIARACYRMAQAMLKERQRIMEEEK